MELKIRHSALKKAIKCDGPDDDDFDFYLDSTEELRKRGIYYITGEITEDSLLEIQQDVILKHLEPQRWKGDIQLIINSCGGLCSETWALIDLLDWCRMDVKTTGMGICSSAGAMLLACGTTGKRVAAPNLSVMVHQGWTGFEGNHDQLVAQTKYITDEQKRDIAFWIKHSKYKSQETVEKYLLKGVDNYFTAREALKHGIVDEVAGLAAEEAAKPKARKKKE